MGIDGNCHYSLEQSATLSQRKGYKIEVLNRLSYPKGKLPKCDMSGHPATVALVTPSITLYYATEEQAEQAWHGSLRAAPPIIGSEEERARREYTIQMSKRALIDLCQQEASKLLVQGRYDLAIPGAIQALTFSKEIFGDGSVEMVPPYLLLSEANLGLGRLQSTEEFLSLANWSIVKSPQCRNAIRSQLHRNLGKLNIARDKLDEALRELSQDIYFSSSEVGPEHIDTSGGYFLVANILYAQRKVESSLAFYDKVVDIWYKFLASVRSDETLFETVNQAQLSEGMDMLKRVLNTRESLLGDTHIATGEASYALGLLMFFVGNRGAAVEHLTSAFEIYTHRLGNDHASTKDVEGILVQLGGPRRYPIKKEMTDSDITGVVNSRPLPTTDIERGVATGDSECLEEVTDGMGTSPGGAQQNLSNSEASLLSQFPSTEEMPRAVMQSPIPLPPHDDDTVRTSPSESAV